MEKFSYLVWVLFFLVVWLPLFISRPDLRRQSLMMGFFIAALTPMIGWWYLQDYWTPVFLLELNWGGLRTGLEEIFLGFFIGAISSIEFEVIFRKELVKQKKAYSWAFPFLLLGALYLIAILLVWQAGLNSIYASFISFALGIGLLTILRRDLIISGFISGLLFAAILFFSYIVWLEVLFPETIQRWWQLSDLSNLFLLGVPIEEIIWGFLWGWVAGMLYETWNGLVVRDVKK